MQYSTQIFTTIYESSEPSQASGLLDSVSAFFYCMPKVFLVLMNLSTCKEPYIITYLFCIKSNFQTKSNYIKLYSLTNVF